MMRPSQRTQPALICSRSYTDVCLWYSCECKALATCPLLLQPPTVPLGPTYPCQLLGPKVHSSRSCHSRALL